MGKYVMNSIATVHAHDESLSFSEAFSVHCDYGHITSGRNTAILLMPYQYCGRDDDEDDDDDDDTFAAIVIS